MAALLSEGLASDKWREENTPHSDPCRRGRKIYTVCYEAKAQQTSTAAKGQFLLQQPKNNLDDKLFVV